MADAGRSAHKIFIIREEFEAIKDLFMTDMLGRQLRKEKRLIWVVGLEWPPKALT